MNIRCFSNGQEVFLSLECVSGFSFKHAVLEDRSVLLPVKCSAFALQRDSYAYKNHIEYPSPDHAAA